ncbi:hypothetical protein JCM5296_000940 [Sporobolomyces johnsonii]
MSIDCSTLPGTFSLCVNDTQTIYKLSWTAVLHPLEIASGHISLSSDEAVVAEVDLWAGNFPPSSAGDLDIACKSFSSSVVLTISLETCNKQEEQAMALQTVAARSAASILDRSPNNVCFKFPRTSRYLWANEDNLRKLSAYYDSLLSSEFAEGSTSSQAVPSSSLLAEYTYEDSDIEADELELGRKLKSKTEQEQGQNAELDGAPFKMVTVVDTAYTTYFAVLVWVATGYIRFAPLRSKFRSDNMWGFASLCSKFMSGDTGDDQARAVELKKVFSRSSPQLPLPTSPKSVYRLAHLLELPQLLQLALNNFKSQLRPANVAYELYSDVACAYEAIRDAALDFAVTNWKEVSKAAGTREMERRAYAGELPKEAMGTVMLLSRKLSETYGGI